jgi:muramoyltetrapeptide carboxypeptidase
LFGNDLSYDIKSDSLNTEGKTEGELVGGNLSMLYSLLGSETSIDTRRKILFIEDLDEYLYHIDRVMQNLKRNGYFEGLKGLIVGSMSDMNDNVIPFGRTAKEIISDTCKAYDFPICFNFPAGHVDDNRALIFGRTVQLAVGSKRSTVKFN